MTQIFLFCRVILFIFPKIRNVTFFYDSDLKAFPLQWRKERLPPPVREGTGLTILIHSNLFGVTEHSGVKREFSEGRLS